MSRRGSCSSGSATTTAAETKTLLLFVCQNSSLNFSFDQHPQRVTLLQTALYL